MRTSLAGVKCYLKRRSCLPHTYRKKENERRKEGERKPSKIILWKQRLHTDAHGLTSLNKPPAPALASPAVSLFGRSSYVGLLPPSPSRACGVS